MRVSYPHLRETRAQGAGRREDQQALKVRGATPPRAFRLARAVARRMVRQSSPASAQCLDALFEHGRAGIFGGDGRIDRQYQA